MGKPEYPVWPPGHPKAGQPYRWLDDDPERPHWDLARQQTQAELYERGDLIDKLTVLTIGFISFKVSGHVSEPGKR